MTTFTRYNEDNAPQTAKPLLAATQKAFGFVPNLQGYMAESPELLAGYSTLWDLFGKSTLSVHEQQVVYLTNNFENNCHYCMAGHTTLAQMQKMDPAVIDALRDGFELPDPRLEALHQFAKAVVQERGFVGDAAVEQFLAAGFTRQNVLEVILGTATKLLSNYTNHIVHTPLDDFMKGNEWTKPTA